MPVPPPGASAAGSAIDRLAIALRRMVTAPDYPAASTVIYLENADGTTEELRPDAPAGGA
jgi:hypothetical protein